MSLRAGRLRSRIDILRAVEAPDGAGGYVETWEPVKSRVPAEVLSLSGRESVLEKTFQGIQSFKITIRFRTDIQPQDQLRYGSLDLNIKSFGDPDNRREQLVIFADTESARKTG